MFSVPLEATNIGHFGHHQCNFTQNLKILVTRKGKGKAIPLQAWTGPEGSRSVRLPDFKTIGT